MNQQPNDVMISPHARFLRVVRTLALVSGVMTPVVLGGSVLVGCGGSESSDPTIGGGGTRALDGGDDVVDSRPTPADGSGGTSVGPDTGHDAFDGIDAGITVTDTSVDGATDATAADAEIGIGGPLVAPEMVEEGVA